MALMMKYISSAKKHIFFKDKEYSNTIHIIGIAPVAVPKEIYDSGKWKESIKFLGNKSVVFIAIRMNFENYCKADSLGKIE